MSIEARCVSSEWLDELNPDDPRAIRSRNDLRRINACMLQDAIMAKVLVARAQARPRTILDLGAGDGTFMLRVARKLAPRWPDVKIILLDRADIVSEETRRNFRSLRWDVEVLTADVLAHFERPHVSPVDIIAVNLFLHHFQSQTLARLLAQLSRHANMLVACEPRRAPFALFASRLLWAIGCNDVSRHDAFVSVQAGFRGQELSELWPRDPGWTLHERPAWPFTHCFTARREGHAP